MEEGTVLICGKSTEVGRHVFSMQEDREDREDRGRQ